MTNLLIFTSLSFVKSKGVFYMLNYLRKRNEKWKIYNWNIFETIKTPFTNFGCIRKDGFYLLILLAFCMFEVKYFNFFKSLYIFATWPTEWHLLMSYLQIGIFLDLTAFMWSRLLIALTIFSFVKLWKTNGESGFLISSLIMFVLRQGSK